MSEELASMDPVTGRTEITASEVTPEVTPEVQTSPAEAGQPEATSAEATPDKGGPEPEESFFDPASIKDKPELMAAYKQMQAAFTRKTQQIKEQRNKIDAYDNFSKDPVGNMQKMAQQMGFQLTRAQAAQALQDQAQTQQQEWQPQTWDEVIAKAKGAAKEEVLQELQPMIQQLTQMRSQGIEKMLDDSVPDWRTYEDEMMGTLKDHPTLVHDPIKLYRLSVPDEVWQSRATQQAMAKLQKKAESAKVAGGSTTHKKPSTTLEASSFEDAVAKARAHLAEQGIRPPGA
jgi:hypothetical protein